MATNPNAGIAPLLNKKDIPSWLNPDDANRIAAYDLYYNIYWNVNQSFKLVQRGNEANPIYVPSGRIIVNTMDRYAGKGWGFQVDPNYGTDSEKAEAQLAFETLFKRERLKSVFENNKLSGLIKGDACFYITASLSRPQGRRITIRALDPATYFPITDPNDVDRLLGQDIVKQVVIDDTVYISRKRYLKSEHPNHPLGLASPPVYGGAISFQHEILEVEDWEDPEEATVFQTLVPQTLMTGITNLPVYHIPNLEEIGHRFGSSEMRGIERLFAGINQSITDEELSLALHGLGMYKTESGQPQDEQGNPIPYIFGPGRVVHDAAIERLTGVTSVTPYLDHIRYLEDRAARVSGASDVAQGIVDVNVAESGVALRLRLGPIIDASGKKDTTIQDVMDNMLFDLREWLAVYEGINLGEARAVSTFDPKLPENKKERFDMLLSMVTSTPPLITMAYFRDEMREMGIPIPKEVTGLAIAQEQSQMQEVMDPYGDRLGQEANAEDDVVVTE